MSSLSTSVVTNYSRGTTRTLSQKSVRTRHRVVSQFVGAGAAQSLHPDAGALMQGAGVSAAFADCRRDVVGAVADGIHSVNELWTWVVAAGPEVVAQGAEFFFDLVQALASPGPRLDWSSTPAAGFA